MTTQRRVLVVDDSTLMRQIVQVALRLRGWSTIAAQDGAEGIALAVKERPDAILLDVLMPGADGPETLSRLRGDPRSADIPVIFLTGLGEADEQHTKLRAMGANGVLVKPFDPGTLADVVAGALGWSE